MHGGVYTAARVANQALAFLLLPIYAHKLGDEGLGIIEVANATRNVLAVLFLQGMGIAWFRLRVTHRDPEERRSFEATVLWYLLGTTFALVAAMTWFGDHLARWLTPGVAFYPLGLMTLCTAATLVFPTLLERHLQIQQKPLQLAVFSVIRTFATLATILWFVVVLERGAPGKIEAELWVGLAICAIAWFWLRPAPPSHVRADQLRSTLTYAWPQMPHALAALVNDMIDRVLISATLGLAAVGVYSVGYRIASITMILMTAVAQAFNPLFVEAMHDAQERERAGDAATARALRTSLAKAGLAMVTLSSILAQGVTATGREVMTLVTPNQAAGAWPVLAPVSLAVVVWCCYAVFLQSMFYDLRSARLGGVIGVLAASSNVVANMLLLPRFGFVGAAWATLISNAVYAVLALRIGMHHAPVPYVWSRWMRLLGWTSLGLATLYACDAAPWPWGLRAGAKAAVLLVALAVTIRISGFDLQTLRVLRRKETA
jgi:O-antigen/teichoic acid export membrane protein